MSESGELDFDATIKELFQQVSWLHYRWLMFRRLFGLTPERVEQLNKHAGFVFGLYQRVLWDVILLDIAKLLSWKGSSGRAVVSLHRAIDRLPNTIAPHDKAALEAHFAGLRNKHEPIIAHRDRRIAHNDVRIVSAAEALDGIMREQIDAAVADIVDLLNCMTMPARGTEYRFERILPQAIFQADVMCHLLISGDWESAEQKVVEIQRASLGET